MTEIAVNAMWPPCSSCGGPNRTVKREPSAPGLETQSFTCSTCGHVTVQTAAAAPLDAAVSGTER